MEIFCSISILFGVLFLAAVVFISENKAVFPLIFIGVILILVPNNITKKADRGKPAPSKVLVAGEKYEVVDIYEKYIIIKSIADNEKLKFIGPLDFGTTTVGTGKYIKTAKGNLEKIE